MLGPATINLAGRLAPGEDPDALAHDTLGALLGGLTTSLHTTFVAADCALAPVTEAAHQGRAEGHARVP
jgi:hypothetical protein